MHVHRFLRTSTSAPALIGLDHHRWTLQRTNITYLAPKLGSIGEQMQNSLIRPWISAHCVVSKKPSRPPVWASPHVISNPSGRGTSNPPRSISITVSGSLTKKSSPQTLQTGWPCAAIIGTIQALAAISSGHTFIFAVVVRSMMILSSGRRNQLLKI